MELNYRIIGRRIKDLRIQRQISQETLAEKVNLSATYISRIETAEKRASLKSLVFIAEILEVTLDYFLRGNQLYSSFEYTDEILKIFDGCSNYEKRIIYEIAVATKRSLNDNSNLR
jgi:transcriptional regulator with XRE-family HTH domain